MRYLPLTPDDRAAMLAAVGASSIDDLFVDVPAAARLSGPIEGLPAHASELSVERPMAALSRQSRAAGDGPFFLGPGASRHLLPAGVDHLLHRVDFSTPPTRASLPSSAIWQRCRGRAARRATVPSSSVPAPIATMSRRASTI